MTTATTSKDDQARRDQLDELASTTARTQSTAVALALQSLEHLPSERTPDDVLRLIRSHLGSQREPRLHPIPPPSSGMPATQYRRPTLPYFSRWIEPEFDGVDEQRMSRDRYWANRAAGRDRTIDTAVGKATRSGDMVLEATIPDGPPWWSVIELGQKLTDHAVGLVIGDREVVTAAVWSEIEIPAHSANLKVNISADIDVPNGHTSSSPFAVLSLDSDAAAVAVTSSLSIGAIFRDDQGNALAYNANSKDVFRAHQLAGDQAPRILQSVPSSITLEYGGTALPTARRLFVRVQSTLTVERVYLPPPADPVASMILIGNAFAVPTYRLLGIAVEGR